MIDGNLTESSTRSPTRSPSACTAPGFYESVSTTHDLARNSSSWLRASAGRTNSHLNAKVLSVASLTTRYGDRGMFALVRRMV